MLKMCVALQRASRSGVTLHMDLMEGLTNTTASHMEWWSIDYQGHLPRNVQIVYHRALRTVTIAEAAEESFVGEAVAVMFLYGSLACTCLGAGRRAPSRTNFGWCVHDDSDNCAVLYRDFSHSLSPLRVYSSFLTAPTPRRPPCQQSPSPSTPTRLTATLKTRAPAHRTSTAHPLPRTLLQSSPTPPPAHLTPS
jgi:hypothetical protein